MHRPAFYLPSVRTLALAALLGTSAGFAPRAPGQSLVIDKDSDVSSSGGVYTVDGTSAHPGGSYQNITVGTSLGGSLFQSGGSLSAVSGQSGLGRFELGVPRGIYGGFELSAGSFSVNYSMAIGEGGVGTMSQTGGTCTMNTLPVGAPRQPQRRRVQRRRLFRALLHGSQPGLQRGHQRPHHRLQRPAGQQRRHPGQAGRGHARARRQELLHGARPASWPAPCSSTTPTRAEAMFPWTAAAARRSAARATRSPTSTSKTASSAPGATRARRVARPTLAS